MCSTGARQKVNILFLSHLIHHTAQVTTQCPSHGALNEREIEQKGQNEAALTVTVL